MKKTTHHFFLCFSISLSLGISLCLPAQSVWQTEVSCGDAWCSSFNGSSLTKTSDGNFLVGLNGTTYGDIHQRRIYLSKYNQEGSLIWEKSYHFGAVVPDPPYSAGPYLTSFIEDINGDILCSGSITNGSETPTTQAYFFRANSNGDSLSLTIDSSYISFSKIIQLNSTEYFIPRVQKGYVRVGFSGEIIDEVNIDDFYGSSSTGVLVHNDNIFLGNLGDNPYFADSSRYQKYDLYTGEFLLQKKYVDIGDLLILDSDDHIVAYSSGLMKMDADFNPIWIRPFDDFEITGVTQRGQAILKTQDGGFILGGDFEIGLVFGVFFIKTDNEGFVEWITAYNNFTFGIDYLIGLAQTNDGGYVFLGRRDDGFKKLVKLNSNGLYTATNELNNPPTSIQVYPNPVSEELTLSFTNPLDENAVLNIYNSLGQKISFHSLSKGQRNFTFSFKNEEQGIYFYTIENKEEIINSGKILISN